MPKKTPSQSTPTLQLAAKTRELDQYRRIFDVLPDIIYKIDAEGRFTYVSESVRELGYTTEELMGAHFSEVVHPSDVESVSRDKVLPGLEGRKTGDEAAPKLFDERRSGKRGTKRLVVRLIPKYLKGQITPRSTGESDPFYGEVVCFGDYLADMMRKPRSPAKHTADFSGVLYGEVSANGHYARASGSQNEAFEGTVGIIRNITDRILLEQQKLHLEEELHHALKMEAVGQLAGGVAHDLNNVLASILGYSELIKSSNTTERDTFIDQELEQRIGLVLSATRTGIGLLRSLLAFARKTQAQKSVVDLNQALAEVQQFLLYTLGHKIAVKLDVQAQHSHILADPSQIQNILINLALNARDAMPQGGSLTFRVENVDVRQPVKLPVGQISQPGPYALLSIADTGTGLDPALIDRIFEPFFTTKPEGQGTGLGLANVLRIVKSHNGFVDVAGFPGQGTTFFIYLPLAFGGAPAVAPDSKDVTKEIKSIHVNARVMVVDDDPSVCDIVKITLESIGCGVTLHTHPADAVEAYRKHAADFDVVLIDMLMPHLNGFECLRLLRETNPAVKAVLITGLSEDIEPERLAEKGFIDAIRKPFNIRHLATRISQIAQSPDGRA